MRVAVIVVTYLVGGRITFVYVCMMIFIVCPLPMNACMVPRITESTKGGGAPSRVHHMWWQASQSPPDVVARSPESTQAVARRPEFTKGGGTLSRVHQRW